MRAVEATLHGEPVDIVSLRDITALVASREEMRAMTMVDDLTGLYNRRGLLALGRQQVAFAQRSRRALLVLYADLDNMKWINDTHGHAEGDRAIEAAAEVLRYTFRRSDVIARVGGDEFAVLSLEVTPGAIDIVSARLDAALAAYNAKGLRPYPVSLSVGASYYDPESPCTVEELLDRADSLMYQQKRERRPSPIQNRNTTTS
jgi:diguanylate cyclase (GGDEF)-like protein